MNWNDLILQVIDMGTFTSIWYWLAVAVSWSVVSHWIIGVPFDMIFRARKAGGRAAEDLDALVAINVRRLMTISDLAGLWLTAFVCFVLTLLLTLGFYYGLEIAQGVFCLAFPMTITGMMTMRISRRYAIARPEGEALARDLMKLRFWIQVVAMVSIFFTAMYGMLFSLSRIPLI